MTVRTHQSLRTFGFGAETPDGAPTGMLQKSIAMVQRNVYCEKLHGSYIGPASFCAGLGYDSVVRCHGKNRKLNF